MRMPHQSNKKGKSRNTKKKKDWKTQWVKLMIVILSL
jgi:hypothetical protein